jgi:hypothetical protein
MKIGVFHFFPLECAQKGILPLREVDLLAWRTPKFITA